MYLFLVITFTAYDLFVKYLSKVTQIYVCIIIFYVQIRHTNRDFLLIQFTLDIYINIESCLCLYITNLIQSVGFNEENTEETNTFRVDIRNFSLTFDFQTTM